MKPEYYMRRCLALAAKGRGAVMSNPLVGCVVEKNGLILGEGYHQKFGEAHAEVNALHAAGKESSGANLYVSLEPCNHYGKTPPCVEAIIKAKIKKVFIASRDTNLKQKNAGIKILQAAGIEVITEILSREARELNFCWFNAVEKRQASFVVKLAMSLDGKINYKPQTSLLREELLQEQISSEESTSQNLNTSDLRKLYSTTNDKNFKWLSSEVSRRQVQRLRSFFDAIIVGSNTILADNPLLTNRSGRGQEVLRIVLDTNLSIPIEAKVFDQELVTTSKTIVFCSHEASPQKEKLLEQRGVSVVKIKCLTEESPQNLTTKSYLDLNEISQYLYNQGIYRVLCEGGAELASQIIREDLCDRLILYHCPILIGEEGLEGFRNVILDRHLEDNLCRNNVLNVSSEQNPSNLQIDTNLTKQNKRKLQLHSTRQVGGDVRIIYDFI